MIPLPHHDIILAYLGHNQQEYILNLPRLMVTVFYCPICCALTHFNQWKTRSAWSSDSLTRTIKQLQVLCTNTACEKTHVIIPNFLNPYKRYVGVEIEESIEQPDPTIVTTEAEESTIRRWKNQFADRLPEILNFLIRLLMIEYENMLSLLDCSQGLTRIRSLLALFPHRKGSTVLGIANLQIFYGGSLIYF